MILITTLPADPFRKDPQSEGLVFVVMAQTRGPT